MKYSHSLPILFAGLMLACAATHTSAPPPPAPPDLDTVRVPVPYAVYIHDTTRMTDSIAVPYPVDVIHNDTVIVPVNTSDTGNIFGTFYVLPTYTGDDWPNLQGAVTWQCWHPGCMIKVIADDYQLSKRLIWANPQGGDYGQVKADISGPVPARNTLKSATFHFSDPSDAGLFVQNCKGCRFENLNLIGAYDFASSLNFQQIDTLAFTEWPDGGSRTSPYAAICIDPFSDPAAYDGVRYKKYAGLESYYLPGMGIGGSTAVDIIGCEITNFAVGVMVTPSMQANGELVNVTGCRIDNVKVCYASTQAQSKANTIYDLMSWGNVFSVVDCLNYGFPRGDGSTAPMVDVMNIAGYTHQLITATARSFPITWKRVYGEGVYKAGYVDQSTAGVHFDDWQLDFQNGYPGAPSPDFYYFGQNTTWSSCMLRLYNGIATQRIVLNSMNNVFRDGSMGSPPVLATLNPSQGPAQMEHVTMFYNNWVLNRNDYDSLTYIGTYPVTVDKSTNTGYIIDGVDLAPQMYMGDLLTCAAIFKDYPAQGSQVAPLGFVTRISGDTIRIANIGQNVQNGQTIDIYDCKTKSFIP